MQIFYFIRISKKNILFFFLLIPFFSFAQPALKTQCDSRVCQLYLELNQKKLLITDGSKKSLSNFYFSWGKENILGVITNHCGTSCSIQYFFNPKTDQISQKFSGVYLVSPTNLTVLSVDSSDPESNTLIFQFIFSEKKLLKINRSFWGSAYTSISQINFDENQNNIIMTYDSESDNHADQELTEKIPIDYRKLDKGGCWVIDKAYNYVQCS
jgi:hypothetical protein